jgi:hypothetical protein
VKRLAMIRMRLYKSRDYVINDLEPEVKEPEPKDVEINELMPIGIEENKNTNKTKKIEKINFNKSLF